MNTRRFPRTLAEAFGPYTNHRLEPMSAPSERSQIWATRVYAAVLVGAIALTLLVGVPS